MKIKIVTLILFFSYFAIIISGCTNGAQQEQDLQRQALLDKANVVLNQSNLDGEPQLSAGEAHALFFNYALSLTSVRYGTISDRDKLNILNRLCFIYISELNKSYDTVYYQINKITIVSQGSTYECYGEDISSEIILKNGNTFQLTSATSDITPIVISTSDAGTLIGRWTDCVSSPHCKEIIIRKVGSIYTMTSTFNDGSSGSVTLTVEIVNGETRYFEDPNSVYGDYMVVEGGNLKYYDNQGIIYSISP